MVRSLCSAVIRMACTEVEQHVSPTKNSAQWGVGAGMTGQCYAIPTMDGRIDIIRNHVDDFTAYAKEHPELTFLVTRIGCGIAGWRDSEIAPLFKEASALDNVTLPEEFWNALGL